jgi:hypothetical protein
VNNNKTAAIEKRRKLIEEENRMTTYLVAKTPEQLQEFQYVSKLTEEIRKHKQNIGKYKEQKNGPRYNNRLMAKHGLEKRQPNTSKSIQR